ncbi:sporulation protein YpjB [Paenibacillus doosanensis]|uniref:Sporulation protein YpjB (SpoYpjB) n=1 Tax=Paenibacillus konkukensis TaxID=2020716 RepID=A0ABY4RHP7_9BACL|nr:MULTISPECIES: sporulation protein YpjB [Paenibacillus]MCS7462496.1 sporulation protein YpjB [Paenibacillus doosanensis]UQZ81897.1 Sporulation protein YpjB (SpoYpjB) [Paenibacillus konkukensis]
MLRIKVGRGIGLLLVAMLGMQLLAGCRQAEKPAQEAEPKPSTEQLQRVELLNRTADDMYKKVMQGDVMGGRDALQQLSDQVTTIRYEGLTTLDGLHALTEAVTQGKRVFNAARFSPDEGQVAAAQIRLATDALSHPEQPMWLQYYKLLQDDVNGIEQAAKDKEAQQFQKSVFLFERHISIIHPSLLISRDATDVEKLDSLVTFMSGQARTEKEPYQPVGNLLPTVRQMLDKLFLKKDTTAFLPVVDDRNPILWTFAIGSVILAALGFAGWRLAKKDNGLVLVRKKDEA